MAALEVGKRDQLKDCAAPFNHEADYAKALRFGDTSLKAELQGYIQHINDRNEQARLEGAYQSAFAYMKQARTEADYKGAARAFEAISYYKDAEEKAGVCHEKAEIARKDKIYADGKQQMEQNNQDACAAAIRLFESIPGWKDADELIPACQRKLQELKEKAEADSLAQERAAEQARIKAEVEALKRKQRNASLAALAAAALAVFLLVTKVIIPNQKYDAAMELMTAGKYGEAIAAFSEIETYRDSAEQLAVAYQQYLKVELKKASVGSYVTFGSYEQDNNIFNGKEYIEWLVLDKEYGRLLVISRCALDCKPYNKEWTDVTWETCTLRKWLNNDFLNAAFNSTERAMIPTVTVSADNNPEYNTRPGGATQDKVFLLSISEVNKYFTSDSARQCKPTAYAKRQGDLTNKGFCWWGLRSPGHSQYDAAHVYANGGVSEFGSDVDADGGSVRPALWINLEP